VSAVDELRRRQDDQVAAVGVLEARKARLAELDAVRAEEAVEYAREWAAARKLDLSDERLRSLGFDEPEVSPRARRRVKSRSGKVESPAVVSEGGGGSEE